MDVNKILGIIGNHDGDAVELAKSLGGALEKRRAQTAKKRAGGQELPPSKFMPNVPRAVHEDGGAVYPTAHLVEHVARNDGGIVGNYLDKIHKNPSSSMLKNIARNSKHESARIAIDNEGNLWAADGSRFLHQDLGDGKQNENVGQHKIVGYITHHDGNYIVGAWDKGSNLLKPSNHEKLDRLYKSGFENGSDDKNNFSSFKDGGEIAAPPTAIHEPHRRAKEQGYSIDGYHVTRGRDANAISSASRFDPYATRSPGETATFFWDNPDAANEWSHHVAGVKSFDPDEMDDRDLDRAERHATAVMPVRIHPGKHLEVDWPEETGTNYYDNRHMARIIREAKKEGYDTIRIQGMVESDLHHDYGDDIPPAHDQIAVLNPAMIRSEFAEFDPEKKGRDDIGAARGGEIDHMAGGGFEDEQPQAPAIGHNNPPTESIGGLSFSPEESNARLTTRLNRIQKAASGRNVAGDPMNERTVVRAPEGSNLPDFVAGKLTFDDWKNRHQALSNADEMKEYASWYQNILGEFQKYYPDENEARSKMRAWLVAQQNVSPAGAMNNVLLQNEQIRRGVPEEEMRAAGMPNPTMAARAVLKGDPIRGGVGQKIADFVDAAEGKNVRSWMNNDERGGSPFVVDVHTARDTGMVDQELINHLTRLGYNAEDIAKLRIDLTGTPTEAAYENRGDWGRSLTQHLNETNWMGRNDWTPSEIQAIGWMGMTKLTRNAEEDSESGLAKNYRRISYEIAPGEQSPWQGKYGSALDALPEHEKYNITKTVSEHAMDIASELAGIDTHNLVHGTGAWEKYQNPASVGQALSTKNAADIAAHALGYLLNQTEVWHNTVKKMTSAPKGFAIDFIENGSRNLSDKNQLKDFWQTIMDADETGLIKGYQPITLPTGEVGIRALVDKGGVKTKAALEKALQQGGSLDKALKNLPFDVTSQGYEAEISKARNDWSKDKNGEAYLERLGEFLGRDPSATLNSARESVESVLEQALDEAHKRNGTSWRETRGKKRGGSVGSVDISHALEVARRAKGKNSHDDPESMIRRALDVAFRYGS